MVGTYMAEKTGKAQIEILPTYIPPPGPLALRCLFKKVL